MTPIPILAPNGPDGSYLIGVEPKKLPKGFESSYPEGTQTHMYVDERSVVAITPNASGRGCWIRLANSDTAISSPFPAAVVHDLLFPKAMEKRKGTI